MKQTIDTDAQSAARYRALAPLIEQFSLDDEAGRQIPATVTVAGHEVQLGRWERATLREANGRSAGAGPDDESRLVIECIAFQARLQELLQVFEHGPMPGPSDLPEFLDRLVTDVAVGLALQEELQRALNRLVLAGQQDHAKHLSSYRQRFTQGVSDLKTRVGADAAEQAEHRAETFVAPPQPVDRRRPVAFPDEKMEAAEAAEPRAEQPAPDLLEEQPAWQPGGGKPNPDPRPEWERACWDALGAEPAPPPELVVEKKKRSIVMPGLISLVVLIVVWAAFILPGIRQTLPPVLTRAEFTHLEPVREVVARPPSLYAKMDVDLWRKMEPAARQAMLEEMGVIAEAAGYNGVHVATTDGITVGEWLKQGGAKLAVVPKGAT